MGKRASSYHKFSGNCTSLVALVALQAHDLNKFVPTTPFTPGSERLQSTSPPKHGGATITRACHVHWSKHGFLRLKPTHQTLIHLRFSHLAFLGTNFLKEAVRAEGGGFGNLWRNLRCSKSITAAVEMPCSIMFGSTALFSSRDQHLSNRKVTGNWSAMNISSPEVSVSSNYGTISETCPTAVFVFRGGLRGIADASRERMANNDMDS